MKQYRISALSFSSCWDSTDILSLPRPKMGELEPRNIRLHSVCGHPSEPILSHSNSGRRCSGIHRGMGTHISRVKSVDLDAWTDEQLQSVLRWGNARANK